MSDPIVAGLPSIASLSCANMLISAGLEFVPSRQVTAGLFQRSVSGTPLAKGLSNGSAVSMFYASAFDPNSTYYIALAFDPVNGPWGLPATLVWQQPQLTSAVVSLDEVRVGWSLPTSTTISGVRAALYDTGTQTALVTVSVASGAGARLVPPLPLKPDGAYTVSLTGVNGMAGGPAVVSSALPVASPVIASAVYASTGAGTCGVSVALSQAPSTQVVVRLLRDGVVVQQATSDSSPVALALLRPLDPRAQWQVDAGALSGSVSGPPCAPFALQVSEVPAVSSVFYAGGDIDVRLVSSATPGATVALFKGTPTGNAWMASATTTGSSANLLVDPSLLQSGFIYTIALTLDATAAPVIWESATTLVWQQPTLVSVAVAGQSVDIGWTLPATTTIAAVNASLYDSTAMAVVASGIFLSNGARLQLAAPLNPAHAYAVSLAGANGIASSAAVSSPALISIAPSIARAVYEPVGTGGYQIAITPAAASSPPGPVVGQLLANGAVVATQAAGSGTVSFVLHQLLDTAIQWQVTLLYQSGVVSGPTGIPVDIPLQVPQLATARCDGAAFDLAWSGASGAVIALLCLTDRTVVGNATVTNGFSTRLTPSSAIDPAKAYAVTLAPITGSVQGLAGPQVPLIVAKPSLSAIAADGAQIAVSFTDVDQAASASELQLANAAGPVMTVLAGLHGGYLPQPQGLFTGLTLSARAVAGGIAGPLSNAAAVIVATPSIASTAFTGTAVTGVATAPAGLALDAAVLNVRIFANDIPFGAPVRAAANGSFSVPAPSTGSAALSLTAFLSGTVSGVPAVAPSSLAFPVLASAASIHEASLVEIGATAWLLVAGWLAPAGPAAGCYEVTLTQDGTALQRWTVAGTTLEQTAPSFNTQKALALTVTPLGPYGRGPESAAVTFLPVAIDTLAARLDESRVWASWTANTAAGTPTAFRLRLVQAAAGGAWVTVAQSPPTAAMTADLALPCALLDAAARFGVTVDAALGNAWVATQTTTALVTSTASIASSATTATGAGHSVTITWTWPGGEAPAAVDAYQPVLVWSGNETALPSLPATPLHATIDLPADVPGDASIGLRALAGPTIGACGAGAPLLVQSLAGLTAAFDGAHIDLSWEELADARVNAYAVTFAASGAPPVVQNVRGTAWCASFAPTTGQTATVTVCAVAGAASGPVNVPLDLVLLAPSVTTAGYDGRNATVAWNAVAGATGYVVSVDTPGGSVLAEAAVSGTTATLPVTLDAAQATEVKVRALIASPGGVSPANSATGPAAIARLLSAAPGISMIAVSAAQVVVTLDTTATRGAGAVSYQASLYAGDRMVAGPVEAVTSAGVSTATFAFIAQPQAAYVARAWALGALAANQPGPPSVARPVISVAPTIMQAGYDGTSVQLAWSDATQPGVTGYAVTITDTTAGTVLPVFETAARSASIAATLALEHTYAVSVQALGNATAGPPSAAANPLTDSVGYFFPASATQPYACLFRGDIRAPGPADIVLYLPQLFGTPPASITQDPFVLTKLANPVDPSLPYTLTVAQSATIKVWSFTANGIRDALRTAYLAFLKKVEDPANGLLPGAMALLQQVIAQALPLSFAETLYYSYGYDPTAGYVNLQPGMRLRVDFENRQFVSADPQGALSGFVGAGTSHYAISALAGGATSLATLFDAFLGPMAVPLVSANTGGGAGVIDLQGSRFQQPFVRLFYPSVFASSDSGGALGPTQNAVIVGAPSIAKMDEATRAYLKDRNFTGVTGIFWTYLRGRATLIPELACSIDGASTFVSVGTTVRQLLASRAPLPFGQGSAVRGIGYRRSVGNVIDQPAQVVSASNFGRSNGLHFGFQPASSYRYAGGLDCFDVPVLGGDALTLQG